MIGRARDHQMLVCVVTQEYHGLPGAGGIGACSYGLVRALLDSGYRVELIVTDGSADVQCICEADSVAVKSIRSIFDQDISLTYDESPIVKSFALFRYLQKTDYGAVHFHDYLGLGYYSALARRQGLFRPLVVTHTHGPSFWVRSGNLGVPTVDDLEVECMERVQIESSDYVVSPSQYMLEYLRGRHVQLPRNFVQKWLLPGWYGPSRWEEVLVSGELEPGALRRIVFFGRQERRKGIELFVEALASLDLPEVELVFLGRFDRIMNEHSGSYILRRLAKYKGPIHFVNSLGASDAISFLKSVPHTLCVIPSLSENLPCTVGECLTYDVPFLARNVGGICELLEKSSSSSLLFNCAAELRMALQRAASVGLQGERSSLSPSQVKKDWADLFSQIHINEPVKEYAADRPLVSVCVTHFRRPQLLLRALSAIEEQTYHNIEVIVCDDGSDDDASVKVLSEIEARCDCRFPTKVVRIKNSYLGAARNSAVAASSGEFILFHDDDNVSCPDMIEKLVQAQQSSGADILTSFNYVFEQEVGADLSISFFPLGRGGEFSFVRNRFGDANALVRRATFDALSGFSELRGVGWEDWEFFLRAYIQGFSISVVPLPLFWYRKSRDGMLMTTPARLNRERIASALDQLRPTVGGDLLRMFLARATSEEEAEQTRSALSAAGMGDLYARLQAFDPNDTLARAALAELALRLGRLSDFGALALWVPGTQLSPIADVLSSAVYSGVVPFKERAAFPGEQLVVVRGWLVDVSSFEDLQFYEDGKSLRLVAFRREERDDVVVALGLSSARVFGFVAIFSRGPSGPRFRLPGALGGIVELGNATGTAPVVSVERWKLFGCRGHVDELSQGRVFDCAVGVNVRADVIVALATFCFSVRGSRLLPALRLTESHWRLDTSVGVDGFLVPDDSVVPRVLVLNDS